MQEGVLFRQLRKDRGLRLQQVADELNSVSFISKFEKGASNITTHRLARLLENINVTIEEFLFLRHPEQRAFSPGEIYMSSPFLDVLDRIVAVTEQFKLAAMSDYDQKALVDFQQIEHELKQGAAQWQKFLLLYVECLIRVSQFNLQKEREVPALFAELHVKTRPFVRYLYQIENWGVFEVLLFRHLQFALPLETIHQLLPTALSRTEKELALPLMRKTRMRLIFSTVAMFLNFRKTTWAKETLVLAESKLKNANDLTNSTCLLFYRGWYQIIAESDIQGRQTCQQAISIFRVLDQPQQVTSFSDQLTIILANYENPANAILIT